MVQVHEKSKEPKHKRYKLNQIYGKIARPQAPLLVSFCLMQGLAVLGFMFKVYVSDYFVIQSND